MIVRCALCRESFEVDESDIKFTSRGQPYVRCPCGVTTFISKKLLRQNPDTELEQAIDKYVEFQHVEPDKIYKMKRPKYPRVLTKLGNVEAIIYKKDGDGISYIHEFNSRPMLLTDKEGKHLYILGDKIRVKNVGIVD